MGTTHDADARRVHPWNSSQVSVAGYCSRLSCSSMSPRRSQRKLQRDDVLPCCWTSRLTRDITKGSKMPRENYWQQCRAVIIIEKCNTPYLWRRRSKRISSHYVIYYYFVLIMFLEHYYYHRSGIMTSSARLYCQHTNGVQNIVIMWYTYVVLCQNRWNLLSRSPLTEDEKMILYTWGF